jgi:hypothetical protein
MATRGTSKHRSREQEEQIARYFGGVVSPSSGASDTDQGDVRTSESLIECKTTGSPGDERRPSLNEILGWLAEVAEQAWEEGKQPVVCVRVYAKGHPLAHPTTGVLDLAIAHAEWMGVHSD